MKDYECPEVFIGCSSEILSAAKAIQNNLQHFARVTIWTQDTFRLSRVTIQEIRAAALRADYAVFILAPDDVTVSRKIEDGKQHLDQLLIKLNRKYNKILQIKKPRNLQKLMLARIQSFNH